MAKRFRITEEQFNDLKDSLQMTEYKFMSNIKQFISDLLADPVNAMVPAVLRANKFSDKNVLINTLCDDNILVKKERLSDKDENGNPKTVTMVVSYSYTEPGLDQKLRKLYNRLYKPYTEVPEVDEATGAASSGQFSAPLFRKMICR